MGTSSRRPQVEDGAIKLLDRFLRGLLLMLGLVGLSWSTLTLPGYWRALPTKHVNLRLLVGERFGPGILSRELGSVLSTGAQSINRAELVRFEALLRLRLAEDVRAPKSLVEAEDNAAGASRSIKVSLSLNPTDALLWLSLYSIENTRYGFSPERLDVLAQSYSTGPLEGLVALRRNMIALAIFNFMSEALQQKVILEFAEIVDGFYVNEAAASLTRTGWAYRGRLLASLEHTDILAREALAKRLSREGVRVTVPGVVLDEKFLRQ